VEPKPLKLPPSVIGQPEVLRVTRELEALNDFFVGADARKGGTPIQPPRLSRILDQLAKQNAYNLLESAHRAQLLSSLEELPKKAPILHISFASEPPPKVMETILIWMRQNIHPQTLLTVGLQPSIAAGFVLRTPNKWFDMSMREYLRKQVPNLAKLIAGAVDGK
jgi:F0F1-type ATP synthase delta subunit